MRSKPPSKKRPSTPPPATHPTFSAEWPAGDGTGGVDLRASGTITWWYRPNGPGGWWGEVAADQDSEDFLRHGQGIGHGDAAPVDVVEKLRHLLVNWKAP